MTERHFYLDDIPMGEAQARLRHAIATVGRDQPLAGELIPLSQALGRITAAPVWARLSSPHYHSAAMDGYAVNAKDTLTATETRPVTLHVTEQAHPVNTGDPLPAHCNAVIMIEHTQDLGEGRISLDASVAPWQHVRMLGEDMVATELVLPQNHKLRPVDLGALAGCGHASVEVRRQPQVILIPTGSELIPADQQPQPGQIIEYNSLVLRGQIVEAGGQANVTAIIPDEPQQLQTAVQAAIAQQPDLILVLSGSSAGSRDFTANIIQTMGKLLVHGVAVRPGHPVIMGMVEDIPVIGVPGYPVSAALTGELFIQPLISVWLGQPSPLETRPHLTATLTRKLLSPIGDDDFVRVTVAQVGERLLAAPLQRGAGVITSLVKADGLAHIPRFSEGVDAGQPVEVMLYRSAEQISQTVMVMGSHDPMLDLLAQYCPITSANVGSMGGLIALKRREAHLAGCHLLDEATGEYNISYLQKYLPETPLQLITFAHREQGLMVAGGNPLNIQHLEDLTRVRYVNRQRGAGTRLLLDYELRRRGISPDQLDGYEREEYTHLGVAAAVASGSADCGMGVRSAALALNLEFISVGWERYDFVIPTEHLTHPGVKVLLETLHTAAFQGLLGSQPGYGVQETGKVQFEVRG